MLFDAMGTAPYVPSYEPFIPIPGATTLIVAFIIIVLILWAEKLDKKHARNTDTPEGGGLCSNVTDEGKRARLTPPN